MFLLKVGWSRLCIVFAVQLLFEFGSLRMSNVCFRSSFPPTTISNNVKWLPSSWRKIIFSLTYRNMFVMAEEIFTSVVDVAFSYSYALKGSSFWHTKGDCSSHVLLVVNSNKRMFFSFIFFSVDFLSFEREHCLLKSVRNELMCSLSFSYLYRASF